MKQLSVGIGEIKIWRSEYLALYRRACIKFDLNLASFKFGNLYPIHQIANHQSFPLYGSVNGTAA